MVEGDPPSFSLFFSWDLPFSLSLCLPSPSFSVSVSSSSLLFSFLLLLSSADGSLVFSAFSASVSFFSCCFFISTLSSRFLLLRDVDLDGERDERRERFELGSFARDVDRDLDLDARRFDDEWRLLLLLGADRERDLEAERERDRRRLDVLWRELRELRRSRSRSRSRSCSRSRRRDRERDRWLRDPRELLRSRSRSRRSSLSLSLPLSSFPFSLDLSLLSSALALSSRFLSHPACSSLARIASSSISTYPPSAGFCGSSSSRRPMVNNYFRYTFDPHFPPFRSQADSTGAGRPSIGFPLVGK